MSLLAPIYNGVLDLLARLSSQRTTNLDHIGSARMAKIDTLEVRLTAARALLLEELSVSRMSKIDELERRLTSGRASNLSEIAAARMAKIDTLESRLTAARAAAMDAAITTRAEAATAVSNADLTPARAANLDHVSADRMAKIEKLDTLELRLTQERAGLLDALGIGVPTIKSVQRGVISLTKAGSATINSVNTSKSLLRNLGESATGQISQDKIFGLGISLVLTNSTTISATRSSDAGIPSAAVSWELTEYY